MKKILIIDDEPDVLKLVGLALRAWGFKTNEARSVRAGLLQAFKDPPNLILCDVNFPGEESGYSAVETLRGNPATRSIPVVLMTGEALFSGLRKGMDLGADDYLPKPFSLEQLKHLVEARLERQSSLGANARAELDELRINLASMLPHELLTPLAGIKGAASLMLTDGHLIHPDELREFNQAILDSAERLYRLIKRFLLFTELQLATGDLDFRFRSSGDTNAVIPRLASEVASRFRRTSDLHVELEAPSTHVSIEAIEIIVGELLDNAFKFSKEGSPVVLKMKSEAGGLLIRISDQGIGFRPEEQGSVGAFRQFNRRLREQQGTGLGLVITKQVIELVGGSLSFESGNPGTVAIARLSDQTGK